MAPVPLSNGLRIGPFTLRERVALGGMAEIWSATEHTVGGDRTVALKVLLPFFYAESTFRSMFQDEVNIARRLVHPNILQVYAGHDLGGHLIQSMELVDGTDLRRLLMRLARVGQWFPVPLALAIARESARALAYVHERTNDAGEPMHIVHRDISPHNLMVTRSGAVKVLDFGIAHAAERLTRTRTGVIKGKLGYMAPEQALAEAITPRVDVFALGVVLWEMLAMQRLFKAPSEAETLELVIQADVPPIGTVNDVVPEEIRTLLARMLARDPAERPQSMGAIDAALTGVLQLHYDGQHGASDLADWIAQHLAVPTRKPGGTARIAVEEAADDATYVDGTQATTTGSDVGEVVDRTIPTEVPDKED